MRLCVRTALRKATILNTIFAGRTSLWRRLRQKGGEQEMSKGKTPQRQASDWNKNHSVGTEVIVWRDNGHALETKTRSEAQVMGDVAVIWVDGLPACYALARVRTKEVIG